MDKIISWRIYALCCVLWSANAVFCHAAGPSDLWAVWIEQDGKKIDISSEVKLKRRPFTFVFSGDKSLGYALISSVEKSDLEHLKTENEISKVIRPTNVRSESPDRTGKDLLVHGKGALASKDNQCQVWSEDTENQFYYFQSFKVNNEGIATARKEIGTIDYYVSYKEENLIPVEEFEIKNIYVLITGLPPARRMLHKNPKFISIKFE